MKLSNLAIVAIATSLAAGSVFAADTGNVATTPPAGVHGGPGGGEHGDHFKKADTNGDGFVSKDEWRAQGDKMFAEIDANHDGKISMDEMKAHREAKRAEWQAHRGEHGGAPTGASAPAAQ